MRDTINQLSQALSSIRKLTQIGAVTTITTGCMYMERFGVNSSLLFFLTLVTSLCTVQSNSLGVFLSSTPYYRTPFRRCVWLFGIGG